MVSSVSRRPLLPSLGLALGAAALAACGEDPGAIIRPVPESPVITGLTAQVSPEAVPAETPSVVTCTALYSDGRQAPLTEGVQVEVSPAAGVLIEGAQVSAPTAGRYEVRCKTDGVEPSNPTPWVVLPADAVKVVAHAPAQAVAGEPVMATCETEDALGNRAPAPDATVRTSPSRDVTVTGWSVVVEHAGTYAVECRLGRLPQVTAPLEVVPAAPVRLAPEANPATPHAGERVEVTCHAVDQFANPVATAATITVDPAPSTLEAQAFEAQVAGTYQLRCAVPGLQVESDVLPVVVQPNLPAAIEILALDPAQPIYASGDTVTPEVRVTDAYGNVIEYPHVTYGGVPSAAVTNLVNRALLLGDGPVTLVARVDPPTHLDQPVEATLQLLVDGLPPEVTVSFPARGEMVQRNPSQPLTIQGTVRDLVSPITDLVVNGQPVTPDAGGAFSVPMSAAWGTNLIEVSAVDAAGNVRQLAQSFHLASAYKRVSPSRTVSGRIPDGLLAHLGQAALDDDASDVDDLATIAKLALQNINVASLIPSPATTYASDCWLATGRLHLHVDRVRYGTPVVDLEARSGGLYANITIPSVVVDMHTSGDVCDIGISVSGSATASSITVGGFLAVSSSGGNAVVTMPSAAVNIAGLHINLSLPSIIDWAVDGIINLFRGAITSRLESAFRDVVRQQVPGVAEDFLNALDLSTGFDLPAPLSTHLSISTGLGTLAFSPGGGLLGLSTAVYATPARSPEPRGGILQESRTTPTFSASRSLGVGLAYDLLNQALYSAWYGGALNLDLADFFDGQLGGSGVTLAATANPLLPPVVRPSGNAAYPVEIQIGDLGVDLDLSGIPNLPNVQSTIYAYAVLQANVTISPAGALQLTIAPNPDVTLDVQSSLDAVVDPTLLRDALETIIHAYLPQVVGDVIGGIPLPTIDLSAISGGFLPQNIVLGLGRAQTRFHSSYLILEGDLVPVP
jgi:hypothetical protein